MIVPYKVKNQPEGFAYATVSLMVLNTLVFLCTSQFALVIGRPAIEGYALRWGVSPLYTLITSMFLHHDIFHLTGNMLFLWIFGPAVEKRLKIPMYLFLYFLSGLAGHVFQEALGAAGLYSTHVPSIGASGCIMGVLGAYCYLFTWSPVCIFYWIGLFWKGTVEVAAVWVIGSYFVLDLVNGFVGRAFHIRGGVANFAHVGGALVGALLVWALQFERDTEDLSKVKAVQSESNNFQLLTCTQLHELLAVHPENTELLVQLVKTAAQEGFWPELDYALSINSYTLARQCTGEVIKYVLYNHDKLDNISAEDLVYLGSIAESEDRLDQALRLYELAQQQSAACEDTEIAMYRSAALQFRHLRNPESALKTLDNLLERFPNGSLLFQAEEMRGNIRRDFDSAA